MTVDERRRNLFALDSISVLRSGPRRPLTC